MYATKLSKSFNKRNPRSYSSVVENDQSIDKAVSHTRSFSSLPVQNQTNPSISNQQTREKIQRAEGAQQNGFENLGLFAAAVVAGNVAGLSATTLNTLSIGYLASRVAYTWIYINNTSEALAAARSIVYTIGVGQIFTLFIKSGNVLRERAANLL